MWLSVSILDTVVMVTMLIFSCVGNVCLRFIPVSYSQQHYLITYLMLLLIFDVVSLSLWSASMLYMIFVGARPGYTQDAGVTPGVEQRCKIT